MSCTKDSSILPANLAMSAALLWISSLAAQPVDAHAVTWESIAIVCKYHQSPNLIKEFSQEHNAERQDLARTSIGLVPQVCKDK